jgi:hypothetical protein
MFFLAFGVAQPHSLPGTGSVDFYSLPGTGISGFHSLPGTGSMDRFGTIVFLGPVSVDGIGRFSDLVFF